MNSSKSYPQLEGTALKIYLNRLKAGFMLPLKNTLNIIVQE